MTSWLGPPLRTLEQAAFDAACADLMRLVQRDFRPSLVVGIRTGGFVVAQSMVRGSADPIPLLPITCRRRSTALKSRLPLLRAGLSALPRPVIDLLRRLEHRVLIAPRPAQVSARTVDRAEADAIAADLRAMRAPSRLLVADDAVDSGVTLRTVLRLLADICPSGTEIRSAAITQTTENPVAKPDYVLFRGTLCRFPWSFDAAA
jgi:hypoxanthine-guanine phosphoribosyltransferase